MQPEFSPENQKVLFFCRGRGTGHAIPDLAIAEAIEAVAGGVEIRFVSYSTGAACIADAGRPVIDLELPDEAEFLDVLVRAAGLIEWLRPDLVVAHEEFAALPASCVMRCPAMFVTDWFVGEERLVMAALEYASEILFLDGPEGWDVPRQAAGKVQFLGPLLREFDYSSVDRELARRELGLPEDGVVVSVLPGAYATEERVPIADLVLGAFGALDYPVKHLVWVAGDDRERIVGLTEGRDDVSVLGFQDQIDRVMVASDCAITKANRKTVMELEALGIPAIALSPGTNPVDDRRARAARAQVFRMLAEVNVESLRGDILAQVARGVGSPAEVDGVRRPVDVAAERIVGALASVRVAGQSA